MNKKLNELLLGLLGLVVFGFGMRLLGEAFRTFTLGFLVLWVTVPIIASLLILPGVRDSFTISGLRRIRVILITASVSIAFCMLGPDTARDRFGTHFVEGYRHWRSNPATDDTGHMYYPGDQWTAKTKQGRAAVSAFNLIVYVSVLGFPFVAWKASTCAISRKEADPVASAELNPSV